MSWSDNPLDFDMPTLIAEDAKFNSETLFDLYIGGMLTDEEFDELLARKPGDALNDF